MDDKVVNDPHCNGCIHYRGIHGAQMACFYWQDCDRLRGCKPGKDCTKYMTEEDEKEAMKAEYSTEEAYRLFIEGKTPVEVAEALGVDVKRMEKFRQNHRKKITEKRKEMNAQEQEIIPVKEEKTIEEIAKENEERIERELKEEKNMAIEMTSELCCNKQEAYAEDRIRFLEEENKRLTEENNDLARRADQLDRSLDNLVKLLGCVNINTRW